MRQNKEKKKNKEKNHRTVFGCPTMAFGIALLSLIENRRDREFYNTQCVYAVLRFAIQPIIHITRATHGQRLDLRRGYKILSQHSSSHWWALRWYADLWNWRRVRHLNSNVYTPRRYHITPNTYTIYSDCITCWCDTKTTLDCVAFFPSFLILRLCNSDDAMTPRNYLRCARAQNSNEHQEIIHSHVHFNIPRHYRDLSARAALVHFIILFKLKLVKHPLCQVETVTYRPFSVNREVYDA